MALINRNFKEVQQSESNELHKNESPEMESAESQEMQHSEMPEEESENPPGSEPASPEEEAEMKRAVSALSEIIYANESAHKAIIQKLSSSNVPPVNKLIDTTLSLASQIDKKLNLDEGVILPFIAETYSRLYELAQTGKLFTLPQDLLQQGLMTTVQMALKAYGVSPQDYNAFAESIGAQNASKLVNFYKSQGSQGQQAKPAQEAQ